MAIWDFKCTECGYEAEIMCNHEASHDTKCCNRCYKMTFVKVMPTKAPHVTYRGPGWTGRIK